MPGDIIVRLNAAPIFDRADIWLFTREHDVGEDVEIAYVRGGAVPHRPSSPDRPDASAGDHHPG